MRRFKNFKALSRAVGIVAAVAIVVGGVTFAALQAENDTIQGSTIETGTANLLISSDDKNYTSVIPGFDFNNLIPGGPAVPADGYNFYLKNNGSSSLDLKMSMLSAPTNPNDLDLSKIDVIVSPSNGDPSVTFSLQDLMNNQGVSINNLDNKNSAEYNIKIAMDSDAEPSPDGSAISNLDFTVDGTAVVH